MKVRNLLIAAVALGCLVCPLAAQKPPQPKSQKEADAIMAIFNATTPDARIEAAESLVQKFADTEFKAVAWQLAAVSAQQKNDYEKMIIYAERTLEVDSKNFAAMLMLASGIAQRTREFDLDKEEKLGKAEKYAQTALVVLKDAPKPRPDLTDEQWEGAKKDFVAQAHESIGMVAMGRKKYDVAITEFKTAIEGSANPEPATKVRLGAAYNSAGKYAEAIAILDQVMADPQLHPTLKQVAQQEKMRGLKAKEGEQKK